MLSPRRSLTNLRNVLSHFDGKDIYVVRIPRIIVARPCRPRGGRKLAT